MPRRIEHIREQPLHISHVDAALAVDVARAFVDRIVVRIVYVIQEQPRVKDVHGAAAIDIAARRHDKRQMVVICVADGMRHIAKSVTVSICARVVAPVVAADEGTAHDVWSGGVRGVPDVVGAAVVGVLGIVQVVVVDRVVVRRNVNSIGVGRYFIAGYAIVR